MSNKLIEALAVTSELMGTDMSPAASQVMYDDLIPYGEDAVIRALHRVRRECKGRLSLNDIIMRIDDGRPGVEEAWAMMPIDESQSVVWTEEMAQAFFVALPLIEAGDKVGARMAFKEKYLALVTDARSSNKPLMWSASLGHDASAREGVILEAAVKGRISFEEADGLVPGIMDKRVDMSIADHKDNAVHMIAGIVQSCEMPK